MSLIKIDMVDWYDNHNFSFEKKTFFNKNCELNIGYG